MKSNPYLASHWRASRVRVCLRGKQKKNLIVFLHERYAERFFEPIQHLKNAGNLQGYGVAMMSLCSLLVESIQCLRDGLPSTNEGEMKKLATSKAPPKYQVPCAEWKNTPKAFEDFFVDHASFFPGVDGVEFYRSIRNGLLHQAQTKNGWTIRVDQLQLCNAKKKVINRNMFATSLEKAFNSYLCDLSKNERESPIWKKARRKIWWLIQLSS